MHALDLAKKKNLDRMVGKNGKPFSVNGIPVFLDHVKKNQGGLYENGLLTVDKKIYSADRELVAWHEFGEIFSHSVGLAFEIDLLQKSGRLQSYIKRHKNREFSLKEIIKNW